MLEFNDKRVLDSAGVISHALMEEKAKSIYKEFDEKRKAYEALEADKQDMEAIEKQVKSRKK